LVENLSSRSVLERLGRYGLCLLNSLSLHCIVYAQSDLYLPHLFFHCRYIIVVSFD
jgi:hypothetical protein